ncbi:MAG: hypothetical protein Q8L29_03055 [archaeon]|nr:hypothetical protein [archaeon]
MNQREKHPDRKNAMSILEASSRQMRYTLTLESNDNSAFNIIRNIYECFRMLGDALLVSRGKLSEDHVEQIRVLENLRIQTERPIRLVDNLRKMRHNINYYGYNPKKIESDDAISLAKACFESLLKAVKEEIASNLRERRLG